MSRSAYVTSIETVGHFRTALCEFISGTKDSLDAIEIQIRRTLDWLTSQMKYWQCEIRTRQEDLVRAKIELTSRKYANRDGTGLGTADHEKAFRKAQARLKEAEQKLANCRRWMPVLEQAITEYHGPARQLSGSLDSEVKHSLALLDQKLAALEDYLAMTPPSPPGQGLDVPDEEKLSTVAAAAPEPSGLPDSAAGDSRPKEIDVARQENHQTTQ
jgi:hypothetical protein